MTSMEINAAVGEKILEAFPETSVDVHHPEVMIHIEIRPMINIFPQRSRDREACRLAQQAVQCFFYPAESIHRLRIYGIQTRGNT